MQSLVRRAAMTALALAVVHGHSACGGETPAPDTRDGERTSSSSPVADRAAPTESPEDRVGERLHNYGDYGPRWSQHNEEIVIRDFFQDERGGFFVDVGCARARKGSTTYTLERELGWTGIAVDALDKWRSGYEEHRPNTQFLHYAVLDQDGEARFFAAKRKPTWSSTVEASAAKSGEYDELRVPAITLDSLLESQGVETIDFLSMDIEDAEPRALAGFDIERFSPRLVCIEAHAPVRDAILRYFEAHGYARIEVYRKYDRTMYQSKGIGELNWYFAPKSVVAERFGQ